MASVTKDQVLAALADVLDPDSGQNVVASGLISGVVVRDGNVGFALEVDPDANPETRAVLRRVGRATAGRGYGQAPGLSWADVDQVVDLWDEMHLSPHVREPWKRWLRARGLLD